VAKASTPQYVYILTINSFIVKLTLYTAMPKLYHVVFSKDYKEVSILDNLLKVVDDGRVRLLHA